MVFELGASVTWVCGRGSFSDGFDLHTIAALIFVNAGFLTLLLYAGIVKSWKQRASLAAGEEVTK